MTGAGFPHSDIHGSAVVQLLVAFGHPRPSSVLGAKASPLAFVAWKNKDARARYAILKELTTRSQTQGRRPAVGPALPCKIEGRSSKQKRRRVVPPVCGRAEAAIRRLTWRTE